MKKIFFLLLLLLVNCLNAKPLIKYNSSNEIIEGIYDNDECDPLTQESIIKNVVVPSHNVKLDIDRCKIACFSYDKEFLGNKTAKGADFVKIMDSFIIRGFKVIQYKITPQKFCKDEIEVLKELKFKFVSKSSFPPFLKVKSSFLPLYKNIFDNFESTFKSNYEIETSGMLIVCHDLLESFLVDFIEWKEAKGISCSVATLSETGNTSNEIKNYIQNIYDTSDVVPDYLLIVGDVDGTFAVPSFYTGTSSNVTDFPYTLLDGIDYIPEMHVGRMSIDSPTELLTIINKTINYEKEPYTVDPGWFKKALIVAGNYSTTPPIPSTPVKVSRWLREKMLDYGYSAVDTVFYPPTYPGSATITSTINNGVGFVNYRGWGDANGWHYPYYHNENLDELNNGYQLPIITSFVCNTGDFANNVDPCFGEKWLTIGTPTVPKGGVVFIGPSDLHTSTKYNNSIFSGFYYGLLNENIFTFASSVLRGKMELYNNFPLNQSTGDMVEFYFYVYNILGDPSISMWTQIPQQINCDLPPEINISTNFLEINCSNLNEGVVTAKKEGEFYNTEIIEDGYAILYISPETEGEMFVTITGVNYIPLQTQIDVITDDIDIGLYEYQLNDPANAGETVDISLSLKNFGSQIAENVTANLSTNNPYINITSGNAYFGSIVSGEIVTRDYQIAINNDCPDGEIVEFCLQISDGSVDKFEIPTTSLQFILNNISVNGDNKYLDPFSSNDIDITIKNTGTIVANNVECILRAYSDAVELVDSIYSCGEIQVNDSSVVNFTMDVLSECYIGRNIPIEIFIEDDVGLYTSLSFSLEVGLVDNTSPTGPDDFGYYAYDSYDTDYSEYPIYNWYEIDPEQGGNGEVILMCDDKSSSIELPFTFKYYGIEYDSITICSNGWISFLTTWMTNFRNWNIPSALGPSAQICVYWDDLIGEKYTIGDTIFHKNMRICYDHIQSEDIFIIEWNECYNRVDDISPEKFELILYNEENYPTNDGNGVLQFNYHTISNPDNINNYATVGIENHDQSSGICYTFANIYPASATNLQNNLAIKFTPDPPDDYVAVDDVIENSQNLILFQNSPNPFQKQTEIKYYLPYQCKNNLQIYNIKGQHIKTIISSIQDKGIHTVIWDGKDRKDKLVKNGLYFFIIKTEKHTICKKMIYTG